MSIKGVNSKKLAEALNLEPYTKKFHINPKVASVALITFGSLATVFGALCIVGGVACAATGYGFPATPVLVLSGILISTAGIFTLMSGINLEKHRRDSNQVQYWNA